MDKKNTILLTVIAVATLLVAVVGATFAYFSLTTDGSSATTVTGQTPKAGTITLTSSGDGLHLKPTMAQFAQAKANSKFYAVSEEAGTPAEAENNIEIAKLALTNADTGLSYSCTANLKFTFEEDDTLSAVLGENDGFLKLTATGTTGFNDFSEALDFTAESGVALSKIYSAAQATEKTVSDQVTFNLVAGTTDNISVVANLWLVNTNAQQNNLADKKLNMKIELTDLACNDASS